MQLIKLDATSSTNSYLKRLAGKKQLEDFTVVVCAHQVEGRGQKGNIWKSQKDKNLTVSVLKRFSDFEIRHSFMLNCMVSLAIYDVLNELSLPKIKVKWPNDIMSGNQKLCGILIENTLKGHFIKQSVIGFGLNVNQTVFENLPQATSLKLQSGIDYDLEQVLERILKRLSYYFHSSFLNDLGRLKRSYEAAMFRKDFRSTFKDTSESDFFGTIRGITENGLLIVEVDDGNLHYFNFKEISYVL